MNPSDLDTSQVVWNYAYLSSHNSFIENEKQFGGLCYRSAILREFILGNRLIELDLEDKNGVLTIDHSC